MRGRPNKFHRSQCQPIKFNLLTPHATAPTPKPWTSPLNPDLQAKLSRLAAEQGRASESLVVEAVERMVNYQEWLLREVDKGLAAAERGEFMDHADVRKVIDERYPG